MAHGGSEAGVVPRRAAAAAPPGAPDALAAAQGRPRRRRGGVRKLPAAAGGPGSAVFTAGPGGGPSAAVLVPVAAPAPPSRHWDSRAGGEYRGRDGTRGIGGLRRPHSAPVPRPERAGRWKCPGVPGAGEGPPLSP